jgi:hypothetical protein
MTSIPTVFLGGTCGGDMWRSPFEETLREKNVSFFNPQVDNWEPWMADMENQCIARSSVVLFPILSSTLGLGSLAEIGFSVLSVLRSIQKGSNRELIILIDPTVDDTATITEIVDGKKVAVPAPESIRAESVRTRTLVRTKVLNETWRQGVHLVDTLDEMEKTMLRLLSFEHLDLTDSPHRKFG